MAKTLAKQHVNVLLEPDEVEWLDKLDAANRSSAIRQSVRMARMFAEKGAKLLAGQDQQSVIRLSQLAGGRTFTETLMFLHTLDGMGGLNILDPDLIDLVRREKELVAAAIAAGY